MGTNPEKIGKYDIVDLIGRGGMGLVYKAIDPAIGRPVVIKMMTSGFVHDPELLRRFYREAQSAGKLQHPNIVTVYELGDLGGNPYLVMEFIDGMSLDQKIRSRPEIPLEEKLSFVIQICNGLQYAHERHIVHRDIKPGNIMIASGGTVKIVDFGLAHIGTDNVTRTGQVMGSINYMAPEQINGQPVDERTDIFATGVVLYQLLTYALPFQGKDTGSTLLKIIHEPPTALSTFLKKYPPELENVIQRALAKDPEARYPMAEEFAIDLIQIREHLKEEKLERYLQAAQELLVAAELEKAQEQLSLVLKMDRQHPRGNELMRELRQRIQKRLAQQRAQELRSKAGEALEQQNFDDALLRAEEAVKLDDTNTQLIHFRDFVREAKTRSERIRHGLQRAESAQAAGELEESLKVLDEVLALDPERAEARALQTTVRNAVAERERRKQLQAISELARQQIAARAFEQALQTLKNAETVDPAAPIIKELARTATAGMEQERRRREIETLVSEIEDALNREDYNTACAKADEGMRRFGDARRLQQLKTLAEKQRQAAEKRSYIAEQIAASRRLLESGKTAEALDVVEKACRKYPAEPTLQTTLAMVKETLVREEAERQKAECTRKAKDLLRRKLHSEAIRLLESAREKFTTTDFDDLIQFARDDAANYTKQKKLAAINRKATHLIAIQEYERAVELLQRSQAESPDEELQVLLADAQRRIAEFAHSVAEAVTAAQNLIMQQRANEAVRLLESQPRSFAKSPDFISALDRARQELKRIRAIADAKEQAREALIKENFERAAAIVRDCRHQIGDVMDIALLEKEINAKRTEVFTRRVESAVADARTLLIGKSYRSALEVLDGASHYVEAISERLKMRYHFLRSHALNGIAGKEAKLQRPAAVPQENYGLCSGTTLAQTRWPVAGAATRVLPPAAAGAAEAKVQEVSIIGQEDSSTFHDALGHVMPIVPEVNAANQLVPPPVDQTEASLDRRSPSMQPVASTIMGPPEATATNLEAAPTEFASSPIPEVSAAMQVQETRVIEPDRAPVEPREPAPTRFVSPTPATSEVHESSPIQQTRIATSEAASLSIPQVGEWRQDTLRMVEKQLATFIGPLAKILVKRAASQTKDLEELYGLLAASLERESDRQAFLAREARHTSAKNPSMREPAPIDSLAAPTSAAVRGELTREVIERAARVLARYVGPISGVLAKKAAQRADSLHAFYLLLAEHVDSETDRARFLQDAGFRDS